MPSLANVWPLFDLTLRTPRLEMHPMRDEDLEGLAAAALAGIHDADRTPFGVPWTHAPDEELPANLAKYQWMLRSKVAPGDWHVQFAIIRDGAVIGAQDLAAVGFAARRTVSTGSWLTRSAQGLGLGKEMRSAALLFSFDYLGAEYAETSAASWNEQSIGVSRSLGYEPNGIHRSNRREGQVDDEAHMRLTRSSMRRPAWDLSVSGYAPVEKLLTA